MITYSLPAPSVERPPRKWEAELDTARQSDTGLDFEAGLAQSAALRSRVARALDRFGLGTSNAT